MGLRQDMVKWVSLKERFAREDKHLLALVVKRDKRTLNFLPSAEKARERRDTELQKVWFFLLLLQWRKKERWSRMTEFTFGFVSWSWMSVALHNNDDSVGPTLSSSFWVNALMVNNCLCFHFQQNASVSMIVVVVTTNISSSVFLKIF